MKNILNENLTCPCQSEQPYETCCQPFHLKKKKPKNALQLMRSRFTAYALCIPDYLIQTTHPASPHFSHELKQWTQNISKFSSVTKFKNLEILEFLENNSFAIVTFVAHLSQNTKDISFTEKSYFQKAHGEWMYLNGQISAGRDLNLIAKELPELLPIAYYGDPILRKVADPIPQITDEIHELIKKMVQTMDTFDGIGLAAPQIHQSIQLFIIRQPIEDSTGHVTFGDIQVFINPRISLPSTATWKTSEGCLSIPTIRGEVSRPQEITIEYTDVEGNVFKRRVSGWEARVIMHENDHLQGVLLLDYLDTETQKNLNPILENLQNRIHKKN